VLGPFGNVDQQTLLMMSNFDPVKSLVNLQGAPQIRSGWREDLDRQARDLMTAADRDLLEARTRVTPVPNARGYDIDYPWPPPPAGGGGGDFSGAGFSGGGALTSPSYNPPVGQPGVPPWDEGETPPSWDPVLDGGTPPPGGGPIPGGPGTYPGSGPSPWVKTPIGPALAPGVVIGQPGPISGARSASGLLPMGGAGGRPGTAGAGAAKGGYVAPPGGMIGGRPQAGKGSGTPPTAGPGTRRRRRPADDDGWAVAAGVPGVLVPDPEPDEHHPGPGVIGIDR
jgi:hypothetical protein